MRESSTEPSRTGTMMPARKKPSMGVDHHTEYRLKG